MRALLVPILLVLPFALGIAVAGPCDSEGQPALGRVELPAVAGHVFYVDDRNAVTSNGIWIYEETNGIYVGGDVTKDLQRGSGSDLFQIICPSCPSDGSIDPCTDPRPENATPDQDRF